jgi:hypothetical protein
VEILLEKPLRRSAVHCAPVSGKRELATFIRLPRLLYESMEGFVPRLDFAERQALDPDRGPFFQHGVARYWIAWRDGKPIGRISANIDHLQSEPYGMFGCLDATDDTDVVNALLGEAEKWLVERGRSLVRGPFALSINGESGLLVEGQTASAMTMMPWHPEYLAAHIIAAGFREVKSLLAFAVDLRGIEISKLPQMVKTPKLSSSMRVRPLNLKDLQSESVTIARLFNDAWQDNWGFVPLTALEVSALTRAFHIFLVPECCVFFELNGTPVAVALILPNLAELTGDFGGKLLPLNWARLLIRAWRKDYRSGRLILLGVAKHLRNSVAGALAPFAMLAEFCRHGDKYPISELEMSWVLEENRAMRSIIERFGGRITKRYALFEKSIAANGLGGSNLA